MSKFRLAVPTLLVAAALLLPASVASADGDLGPVVSGLAGDAVELLTAEHDLVSIARSEAAALGSVATDTQTDLRSVDERGAATLAAFDRLDVELTDAIRVALDRLPPDEPGTQVPDQIYPPDEVYDAAKVDLTRIEATPYSVIATRTTRDGASGPAIGLLVVATLSLLVLGLSALTSMMWRGRDDELEAMAWSDGLTGLANRRRLDHDLHARRLSADATAVIMVDVDHFKSVNDRFGHQAGDDVLRTISEVLAGQVRHTDVVYRYGGEEFCVLLPNTSTERARVVANRIVEAAHHIELPDHRHVTVSVGVASAMDGDLRSAVERADRALYEAKDLGRDRAITAAHGALTGS